ATVLIRHPLYLLDEQPRTASAGPATATLRPGGAVVGKVMDADGDPVRGVVTLVPESPRGMVLSGNVAESGKFGFGGLPAGKYTVAVAALPNADGSFLVFDPRT